MQFNPTLGTTSSSPQSIFGPKPCSRGCTPDVIIAATPYSKGRITTGALLSPSGFAYFGRHNRSNAVPALSTARTNPAETNAPRSEPFLFLLIASCTLRVLRAGAACSFPSLPAPLGGSVAGRSLVHTHGLCIAIHGQPTVPRVCTSLLLS